MNEETEERWLYLAGLKNAYQISNLGRIRRVCPFCGPEHSKVMVPEVINGGYHSVVFTLCYKRTRKLVHVLVAEMFIGPRPPSHDVNHIDGNKTNNTVANLEYLTRSENLKHAFRTGIRKTKLSPDQVREIKRRLPAERKAALAAEYGVSNTVIKAIATGKIWDHVH